MSLIYQTGNKQTMDKILRYFFFINLGLESFYVNLDEKS